jgi:hypothetical protein
VDVFSHGLLLGAGRRTAPATQEATWPVAEPLSLRTLAASERSV